MSQLDLPVPRDPELDRLDQYLEYLVMERVAEYTEKVTGHDPEVQKIRAQFDEFLAILRNLLPTPAGETVLRAIDETSAHIETRLQELAYKRGLLDGVELTGILQRIKRGESQDS
jgi:hypothetical protein